MQVAYFKYKTEPDTGTGLRGAPKQLLHLTGKEKPVKMAWPNPALPYNSRRPATEWNNRPRAPGFFQRYSGAVQTLLLAGCLGLALMVVPCLVPGATEAQAQGASCSPTPGPAVTRRIILRGSAKEIFRPNRSPPTGSLEWQIKYTDTNRNGCLDSPDVPSIDITPPPGPFAAVNRLRFIPHIPGVSLQTLRAPIICPAPEICNNLGMWVFYTPRQFGDLLGTTATPVVEGYVARPRITFPADNSTVRPGVPFIIEVRFDRPVIDFDDITDVRVSPPGAATVAGFEAVPEERGEAYTVEITPDLSLPPGSQLSITIPAAAARDVPDLNNNAAGGPLNVIVNPAPRISSLVHQNPATSPTDADTLTWRMMFSRPVQNVDSSDFTVTGANGTNVVVTPQGNSNDTFHITVSGGNLANLTGTVTLGLAVTHNIADPNTPGRSINRGLPPGAENIYELVNLPPRISSLVRQSPVTSPTAADTLTWRMVFSMPVRNVDGNDFTVTGVNGTNVAVMPQGSNNDTFDVTVSGGGLAGLNNRVMLGLEAANDITGLTGNALVGGFPAGAEDSYVLDNTSPLISSLVRQNPAAPSTDADTLTWRVAFSRPVQNVDNTDFRLTGANGANVAVTPQGSNNDTFDVTVSGGNLASLNNRVMLGLEAANDITDLTGNALVGGFPAGAEDSYVLSNTSPLISSLVRHNPTTSPTDADTLTWRLVFSGAVQNVDSSDFRITGPNNPAVVVAVTPQGSNNDTYDVTASGGNLPGLTSRVMLGLEAANDITDLAGNALVGGFPPGAEDYYILVNSGLRVKWVLRDRPFSQRTSADTLTWRVAFYSPVQNVDGSDFTVTGTTGTVSTVVPVDEGLRGRIYNVTVSGGDLDGLLNRRVTLGVAATNDIVDFLGNALDGGFPPGSENYYDLDNIRPRVNSLTRLSPDYAPTPIGGIIWRVIFSRPVYNVDDSDFRISGISPAPLATVTVTPQSDTTYDIAVTGTDRDDILFGRVTLHLRRTNDIEDMDHLALVGRWPLGAEDAYWVDDRSPRIRSLVRHNPTISPTAADVLTWRMVFFRPVQNVDSSDFTVTGAGSPNVAIIPRGNDNSFESGDSTFDVVVSGGNLANLAGRVELDLVDTSDIADSLGNALDRRFPPEAENYYDLDNTLLEISSLVRDSPTTSTTTADVLTWRMAFSTSVQNVDGSDFTVTGANGANVLALPDGNNSYKVRVYGGNLADLNGRVTLGLMAANDIANSGGDRFIGGFPPGAEDFYVLDNTGPRITSLMRHNPATSPTAADVLTWRMMFSTPVQNVDSSDFTVIGANSPDVAVTQDGNNGDTWDVTVSGGDLADLNGTVWLDLVRPNDIVGQVAGDALIDGFPAGAEDSYLLNNPGGRLLAGVQPRRLFGNESVTITVTSQDAGTVRFISAPLGLDNQVVLRNGSGTTGRINLLPGNHGVDYVLPGGFASLSASCSSDDAATTGSVDKAAGRISITIAPNGVLACHLIIEDVATRTVRQIRQFMDDRANIIMAHRPNRHRRIARLKDETGSSGLNVAGQQMIAALPMPLNIAIDEPNQEEWEADISYSCTQDNKPSACHDDIWLEGTIGRYSTGEAEGEFGIVHAGVDRLTEKNVLMGITSQFDRVVRRARKGKKETAKARSLGWMAGPYVTAQLDEQLYFDAGAGAGTATNHLTMPGYGFTDRFTSTRLSANTALFGDFNTGQFNTRPKVGLVWFRETSESYHNGHGVRIPRVKTGKDDLEVGVRITHSLPDGTPGQYAEADSYLPLDGDSDDERYALGFGVNVPDTLGGRTSFVLSFDTLGNSDWYSWGLVFNYHLPVMRQFGGTFDVGLSFDGEHEDSNRSAAITFGYTFPF